MTSSPRLRARPALAALTLGLLLLSAPGAPRAAAQGKPAPVASPDPAPVASPAAPAAHASSETAALLARAADFARLDREFGVERLAVARAEERLQAAQDAAQAFRRGKPEAELRAPERRRELELLALELQAAEEGLQALTTGAARGRFVSRRDRLVREWTSLLRDLEAALARRPDELDLRLARGELLSAKGEFGAARKDAEAVVIARPDDPRALLLLGMCLATENKFEDSAALFQRAHDLGPDDERRAYVAIGLFCTNRFAEARAMRDRIARPGDLAPQLQMRCAWWLTDGALDHEEKAWARELEARARDAARGDLPRVRLETTQGPVTIELFEDDAPNAVAGFIELVLAGHYDGLAFHRVIPNLVAQTGDPSTRAPAPGPVAPPTERHDFGYRLKDDPRRERGHFRGTVSMARRDTPDSATGQVFFVLMPAVILDELHASIGRVLDGQSAVDRLGEDDRVVKATVVRRREHPYVAEKLRD